MRGKPRASATGLSVRVPPPYAAFHEGGGQYDAAIVKYLGTRRSVQRQAMCMGVTSRTHAGPGGPRRICGTGCRRPRRNRVAHFRFSGITGAAPRNLVAEQSRLFQLFWSWWLILLRGCGRFAETFAGVIFFARVLTVRAAL